MYPVAKKLLDLESSGDVPTDSLWLTCSTNHNSATDPTLDFVLSVTPGPQGGYPVFICTPLPLDQLKPDYILPRMGQMVEALCASVPLERVYSVFAPSPITHAFAEAWTRLTGVELDSDPEYYSAKLTHCDSKSFRNRRSTQPLDRSYIMRPAVLADIPAAAELCHGFAAVSVSLIFSLCPKRKRTYTHGVNLFIFHLRQEPFTLSHEGAVEEATYLVRNSMLWVHEIIRPGEPAEMASIVATTRSSESVAGITKVFTNPDSRNMGCAERLVRTVCQRYGNALLANIPYPIFFFHLFFFPHSIWFPTLPHTHSFPRHSSLLASPLIHRTC